jgi:hypothetical protein
MSDDPNRSGMDHEIALGGSAVRVPEPFVPHREERGTDQELAADSLEWAGFEARVILSLSILR